MPNPFKSFSLRSKKPAAAAAAKAPIGLKAIDSSGDGVGIVKAIQLGSEYGSLSSRRAKMAEVTVQFGEDRKPRSTKESYPSSIDDEPVRSRFFVPTAMAQGLSIGQRVRVSIEAVL